MSDSDEAGRLVITTAATTGTTPADQPNGKPEVAPTAAATIILFREIGGQSPSAHLMVKRTRNMAFAAGALTFPGGKIEADDHALAAMEEVLCNHPADRDECAHRIGGIRELLEEAGIALGVTPGPDAETLPRWRTRLKQGEHFSAILRENGHILDLGLLTPWARWCPRPGRHRRFDTRFYIARVDPGADVDVNVDQDELQSHVWISAQRAIDGAAVGEHHIIFPTMRNLERLAAHSTFERASEHARSIENCTISPKVIDLEGERWLCIPKDAGYPVTRQKVSEITKP